MPGSIPETGYGSWAGYYSRRDVARKANKSLLTVICEHNAEDSTLLVKCGHALEWMADNRAQLETAVRGDRERAARG